jgi:hypothetical protein
MFYKYIGYGENFQSGTIYHVLLTGYSNGTIRVWCEDIEKAGHYVGYYYPENWESVYERS